MEPDEVLKLVKLFNPAVEPQLSSKLAEDLKFDSIDIFELASLVEDEFDFPKYGLAFDHNMIENWITVSDVVRDVILVLRIGKRARDSHFNM